MINSALEPLYSRVFSFRERIYRYCLPVLITKDIFFFILRQHSSRCVSLFLLRMLYIDWVPIFCWRIDFKRFGIKGLSIFVARVIL